MNYKLPFLISISILLLIGCYFYFGIVGFWFLLLGFIYSTFLIFEERKIKFLLDDSNANEFLNFYERDFQINKVYKEVKESINQGIFAKIGIYSVSYFLFQGIIWIGFVILASFYLLSIEDMSIAGEVAKKIGDNETKEMLKIKSQLVNWIKDDLRGNYDYGSFPKDLRKTIWIPIIIGGLSYLFLDRIENRQNNVKLLKEAYEYYKQKI